MTTAEQRMHIAYWRRVWHRLPNAAVRKVINELRFCGGNIESAASRLGVTPRTLRKWLRRKPELQSARESLELASSLEFIGGKS